MVSEQPNKASEQSFIFVVWRQQQSHLRPLPRCGSGGSRGGLRFRQLGPHTPPQRQTRRSRSSCRHGGLHVTFEHARTGHTRQQQRTWSHHIMAAEHPQLKSHTYIIVFQVVQLQLVSKGGEHRKRNENEPRHPRAAPIDFSSAWWTSPRRLYCREKCPFGWPR